MFTGVTAGNTAFAESDEIDDILEDFCEMTLDERSDILSKYDLDDYAEKLAIICDIEDEYERENSLNDVIYALELEVVDETGDDDVVDSYEDCVEADGAVIDNECTFGDMVFVNDDDDETDDDVIDSYEDCVEAGYPVMESFPEQCMIDDGTVFVNDEDDDDDDHEKFLVCHKDQTLSIDEHAVRAHLGHGDSKGHCEGDLARSDYLHDKYSNKGSGNLRDHFAMYCDMTTEEREEKMASHHDDLSDDLRVDMVRYCEMSEDEQDDFRDIMMDRMDELHDSMKDNMMDRPHMDYKKDMREHLDRYCEMTDEEKRAFVAENDKAEDHVEKMNRYCTLDESDRVNFLEEHKDEYMKHMKAKMHDKMTDKKHMDYDRLCELSESDLAAEIDDSEKLDRISDWCEMTPEEREDYKKEHHDDDRKEKHLEKMEKFSDKSDRLKAMIMDKRDISDERHEEIRMKFESKHGEDSDKKRSEIKMKYKDHMLKMKFKMSDERKSDVHERLAEMKAYKAELRESSEMTDEEKQQLREEFIEKAKDMQLAWISPRTQMTAGIDSAEVECREGYSLVMKASNGVAMCLKADSALKMIDRGIVIPAN